MWAQMSWGIFETTRQMPLQGSQGGTRCISTDDFQNVWKHSYQRLGLRKEVKVVCTALVQMTSRTFESNHTNAFVTNWRQSASVWLSLGTVKSNHTNAFINWKREGNHKKFFENRDRSFAILDTNFCSQEKRQTSSEDVMVLTSMRSSHPTTFISSILPPALASVGTHKRTVMISLPIVLSE